MAVLRQDLDDTKMLVQQSFVKSDFLAVPSSFFNSMTIKLVVSVSEHVVEQGKLEVDSCQ